MAMMENCGHCFYVKCSFCRLYNYAFYQFKSLNNFLVCSDANALKGEGNIETVNQEMSPISHVLMSSKFGKKCVKGQVGRCFIFARTRTLDLM